MKSISVDQLESSDLYVDAIYQGSRNGNAGDDPLHKLLGTSTQGGFRYLGERNAPRLVVLTSSLADPEWPDFLDPETGIFTYFGDNKKPGVGLHETPRFGNELLRRFFDATHTDQRQLVPPILVFTNTGVYRDMAFRGLLVPGVEELTPFEDLVAIWKVTKGERFQNYRAKFSVLDEPVIRRDWIEDLRASIDPTLNAPKT